MFEIRAMTAADHDVVMPMVQAFYQSPAVDHDTDPAVLERTFRDAVDPAEPLLRGMLLVEDGQAVGYAYLTECYSGEVGGRCVFFEEMYFTPACRGKGYGEQVIRWAMEQHPECARYRLEVTGENRAARLYERMGFRYLDYKQMVIDR